MNEPEVFANVRAAYERRRSRDATRCAAFLAVVALPLVWLSPHLALGASFAIALCALGFFATRAGLEWERGAWTGALAGLVPLALALAARPFGHGCELGGECYSWCMPACALGAAIASGLVTKAARGSDNLPVFAVSAGAATLLVGSLGCSCVSTSGVYALVGVYLLTSTPALLLVRRAA